MLLFHGGKIMLLTYPAYYDHFRCIAGSCPDSCCKEWDIQVDAASAARYRTLPGNLGQRLRQVLVPEADGSATMTIVEGRCPMWRSDGLCRIQAELGEENLCQVCRDFPRLRHDYGNFIEYGLELSCPEAAKHILADQEFRIITQNTPGGTALEYDADAMAVLLRTREIALNLLREPGYSLPQTLRLLLLYGYQAQAELDGDSQADFDTRAVLSSTEKFSASADIRILLDFFAELEILTPVWASMLQAPSYGTWPEEGRSMAGYLIQRYWLQAISDYDLVCRVKLIIVACLLVNTLGGTIQRTAQLFSKEIENDADNINAILDAAYTHPAFTDANLLYWLQ